MLLLLTLTVISCLISLGVAGMMISSFIQLRLRQTPMWLLKTTTDVAIQATFSTWLLRQLTNFILAVPRRLHVASVHTFMRSSLCRNRQASSLFQLEIAPPDHACRTERQR